MLIYITLLFPSLIKRERQRQRQRQRHRQRQRQRERERERERDACKTEHWHILFVHVVFYYFSGASVNRD